MQKQKLEKFDFLFISFFRKYGDEFGRIALFIIFFWFGILKVFGLSPAGPLVMELFDVTFLQYISTPEGFLIGFGVFEVLLGILALIPKLERITFLLLALHLITTVMPLWLLTDITWYAPFVPTLVGQYIMKNVALLALGLLLFARIKPMTETHRVLAEKDRILS